MLGFALEQALFTASTHGVPQQCGTRSHPTPADKPVSIKIYADPIPVNCRKVIAGLDLIGAPYELVRVDFFKGDHKAEPYLSLNPNASVPAMTDGGLRALGIECDVAVRGRQVRQRGGVPARLADPRRYQPLAAVGGFTTTRSN